MREGKYNLLEVAEDIFRVFHRIKSVQSMYTSALGDITETNIEYADLDGLISKSCLELRQARAKLFSKGVN